MTKRLSFRIIDDRLFELVARTETPDWQHGLVVGHLFEAHDINRFGLTIVPIENGLAHYQGRLYFEKEILTA